MKSLKLILATMTVLLVVPPSAASAGGRSVVTCAGSWNVEFEHPVGLTPGESRFIAPPGSLTCVGAVDGSPAKGPGTFRKRGTFEGSCISGKASGRLVVDVLTSDGWKSVKTDFFMVTGPGLAFKFGESLLGPLTMVFVPTQGDCVLTPVPRITAVGEFSLRT